mmetsp:Transcript_23091/g.54739  ORF Transcript_23091/g.54739 Transcript_23091/m.54739 type:complete len:262 (+) Transcript_23091:953-1738(+)
MEHACASGAWSASPSPALHDQLTPRLRTSYLLRRVFLDAAVGRGGGKCVRGSDPGQRFRSRPGVHDDAACTKLTEEVQVLPYGVGCKFILPGSRVEVVHFDEEFVHQPQRLLLDQQVSQETPFHGILRSSHVAVELEHHKVLSLQLQRVAHHDEQVGLRLARAHSHRSVPDRDVVERLDVGRHGHTARVRLDQHHLLKPRALHILVHVHKSSRAPPEGTACARIDEDSAAVHSHLLGGEKKGEEDKVDREGEVVARGLERL